MRIASFELLGDLKNEYMELRQNGQSRDQVVRILMARYHKELTAGAEDDGLLFWVGLADAQYSLKELSNEISSQGLMALEQLRLSIPGITPGDIEKRRKHYACAPMPERTQVRKPRYFRCQWRIGDTFAYQLSGPEAEKNGVAGEYILLRKVDELESNGRITPVVTLTHWKNTPLPSNEAEFQRMPLLRINHGRMGSPQSMYEYRLEIVITQKKQIDNLHLQYLGNFSNVPAPKNEYYFGVPGYVTKMLPKDIDQDMYFYCYTLQSYYEQQ